VGARFENMIAMHLKKSIDFWNDAGEGTFALHYVRDLEKREVDFLVLKDKKPWMLVECKLKGNDIPKSLQHMTIALKPVHSVLVTSEEVGGSYRVVNERKYWVTGAAAFLGNFV